MKKGYLKKETEGFIMAAQDQALRTNWYRHNIEKENVSPTCRMCEQRDETIAHIISECPQLAQNEYMKIRHDKAAAILHWNICKQFEFPHATKSYESYKKNEES